MDNFSEIVERFRKKCGFSSDKEVAEVFSLAPPNFNRAKKKGGLSKKIIEWCDGKDFDLNFIFYGKAAEPYSVPEEEIFLEEDISLKAVQLLTNILASKNEIYIKALMSNLVAFDDAVNKARTDRRKKTDAEWPPEKERRQAGDRLKASQG